MWVNWYIPKSWQQWARSAVPNHITILKTTMVVKSHWKQIKKQFLGDFNRPRIDFVFWILTQDVIRHHSTRIDEIRDVHHRMGLASWRGPLKAEWRTLLRKDVDPEFRLIYHTDPYKWTCSCMPFLNSRFLLCKHIVHCFEIMDLQSRLDFFDTVQRSRTPPFWKSDRLIIQPEFRSEDDQIPLTPVSSTEDNLVSDSVTSTVTDSLQNEMANEMAIHDMDQTLIGLEEHDAEVREFEDIIQSFRDDLARSIEIMEAEFAKGNYKYALAYVREHHPKIQLHLAERDTVLNKRLRPNTWKRYHHGATMYTS